MFIYIISIKEIRINNTVNESCNYVKVVKLRKLTKEDSLVKELSLFLTKEQVHNWITVAKLESGVNLNSTGVLEYHNYFGLSYGGNLIRFKSLKECVDFLKTLLSLNCGLLTEDYNEFAIELVRFGWAEDPLYYNKYVYLRRYLYER